jgi:hypothetical protein
MRAVLGVFRIKLHADNRVARTFAHQHEAVNERRAEACRQFRNFVRRLFQLLPRSFELPLNIILGAVFGGTHGARG